MLWVFFTKFDHHTVDGRNPAPVWYGVYPTIYKVLYIPGGCFQFLPSTVVTQPGPGWPFCWETRALGRRAVELLGVWRSINQLASSCIEPTNPSQNNPSSAMRNWWISWPQWIWNSEFKCIHYMICIHISCSGEICWVHPKNNMVQMSPS